MNVNEMYVNGEYLNNNPTWDMEDAPWKAGLIFKMMEKHHLEPKKICEVGCGSGAVLQQLQLLMPEVCIFNGYDISPQAIELCGQRTNEKLHFHLKNFSEEPDTCCDIILIIDLLEHLEDYFLFLREIRNKSQYKLLHIPLEMFVISVMYPMFLLGQRKKVGHLHFFTKETAIQTLQDLGYEIIDYTFTAGYSGDRDYGIKDKLLKIPRGLFYPLAPDFTVRLFGGYSLLVLVK